MKLPAKLTNSWSPAHSSPNSTQGCNCTQDPLLTLPPKLPLIFVFSPSTAELHYFYPQAKALGHHPKFAPELCLRFLSIMLSKVLKLSILNQATPYGLLSLSFCVLFSLDRRFPHFPDARQGKQAGFKPDQLSSLFNGICTPFTTFFFWIIVCYKTIVSSYADAFVW